MIQKEHPPISYSDKYCFLALAGILISITVIYEATDGAAIRASEQMDKPLPEVSEVVSPISYADYLAAHREAMEIVQDPIKDTQKDHDSIWYREDIPLPIDLQCALKESCEEHSVPVNLVLGLIQVESSFRPEADNGLCYGLMQLNKRYFPDGLSPEDNIRAGVAYLGELLEQYGGNTAAALTAYNQGSYKGSITNYAKNVLQASEKWGFG